jgi:hypothetical protein
MAEPFGGTIFVDVRDPVPQLGAVRACVGT